MLLAYFSKSCFTAIESENKTHAYAWKIWKTH